MDIEHGSASIQTGTSSGQPLVNRVMNDILSLIKSEGLRAGQALPSETSIASRFGVSRPVVREALRSLVVLSIVDIGIGRRARVRVPDGDVLGLVVNHAVHTEHVAIQQVFDVRRTVEMRTVELAALRRSPGELDLIAALAAAMRRDFRSPDLVLEHDIAFHTTIGQASRNPMFDLIVRSFDTVTRATWPLSWAARSTDAERLKVVDLHDAVVDAIEARDPSAAVVAMAEHFDSSSRALVNAGVV